MYKLSVYLDIVHTVPSAIVQCFIIFHEVENFNYSYWRLSFYQLHAVVMVTSFKMPEPQHRLSANKAGRTEGHVLGFQKNIGRAWQCQVLWRMLIFKRGNVE